MLARETEEPMTTPAVDADQGFTVTLWFRGPSTVEHAETGFNAEFWQLPDARDVGQVLDWLEHLEARPDAFTVYVLVGDDRRVRVRVAGSDPTSGTAWTVSARS